MFRNTLRRIAAKIVQPGYEPIRADSVITHAHDSATVHARESATVLAYGSATVIEGAQS